MKLNEHKIDHLDKEAFALIELLTVTEIKPSPRTSKKEIGSLSEQMPIITFSNVTEMVKRQGNKISQFSEGSEIGFNEENGKRFQKFVSTIANDNEIINTISRDFIQSKSWKWLFNTKRNAKAETNFSNYIQSEMEDAIQTLKFHFPIVYLNIEQPFKIGDVDFGYFTSEYFDKYIEAYTNFQPDKKNPYLRMKETYKGTVYAATSVRGEKKKAQEIALDICSLSTDILKICSNTLDYPQAPIDFDIDRRSNYNPQSEVIIELPDFMKGLTTNLSRPAAPYTLDKVQYEYICKRKLEAFHNFIVGLTPVRSEMEKLIIQGIKRFAKALSNANYFQRVAELFTVLESLLLLHEDSTIIDTVCRYSSKLVTKDKETRKTVVKVLKDMYKVRSSWVHHAKGRPFQMNDLANLQKIVHALLHSLILKSHVHKTKETLLSEIDDAILGAY